MSNATSSHQLLYFIGSRLQFEIVQQQSISLGFDYLQRHISTFIVSRTTFIPTPWYFVGNPAESHPQWLRQTSKKINSSCRNSHPSSPKTRIKRTLPNLKRSMTLVTRSTRVTMKSQGAAGTARMGTQGTENVSLANIETGTEAETETDIVQGRPVVRERGMMQNERNLPPSRRAFPVCL